MSLLIVGLDNTIVNVALPSIGRDLHASVSGLQWTVSAYTLVIASLLLLSGSMADRFGRRRVFQLGLLLFTLGSLLCSLAPSLTWLVAFRMLQGVGGSMLNPVAMSIIRNTFEDPRERAQAIGLWGATVGVSFALGPVVGGALVDSVGWPSIFWINIPIGLAALVLTARFVPESRAEHPRRFDALGQLLVVVMLATLTFAIIEGPRLGWTSARELALFVVVIASFAGLLRHESRHHDPLIELGFFRSIPFSGAAAIAVSSFAALGGYLFLNTLYLQEVRGLSALHAGLYVLPLAAMTIVFSPLSGRLVGRRGTRVPLVLGGLGITASSVMLLVGLSSTTSVAWLIAAYVVFGIGFGMVNPPITVTAVSGMPPAQAGVAAAVASTSRQVGQTLGVAVVGAIAAPAAQSALRLGLVHSSGAGWAFTTACGVLVLVLGVATTTRRAQTSARAAYAQFGELDAVAAG